MGAWWGGGGGKLSENHQWNGNVLPGTPCAVGVWQQLNTISPIPPMAPGWRGWLIDGTVVAPNIGGRVVIRLLVNGIQRLTYTTAINECSRGVFIVWDPAWGLPDGATIETDAMPLIQPAHAFTSPFGIFGAGA